MSERITRRKTGETRKDPMTGFDCNIWSLERGDEVVGQAYAVHKTRTQRFFEAELTLDGYTAKTASFSIREAVEEAVKDIDAQRAADITVTPASEDATV